MNRPVLKKVRIFGHSPDDIEEENALLKVFDDIDVGNTGQLTKDEMKELFKRLNLVLKPAMFEKLFLEMDATGSGSIDYREFRHWWYQKKDGKPHMEMCPVPFLDMMALELTTHAYDIDEAIVEKGEYGLSFGIILGGTVKLWRDLKCEQEDHATLLASNDREACFGFMACLKPEAFKQVAIQCRHWTVRSQTYIDLAWLSRESIVNCFKEAWPEGYDDMVEVAFEHYDITEELANTVMKHGSTKAFDLGKSEMMEDLMAIKSSELLIVEHTDKIDHDMGALNTKVDGLVKEMAEIKSLLKSLSK